MRNTWIKISLFFGFLLIVKGILLVFSARLHHLERETAEGSKWDNSVQFCLPLPSKYLRNNQAAHLLVGDVLPDTYRSAIPVVLWHTRQCLDRNAGSLFIDLHPRSVQLPTIIEAPGLDVYRIACIPAWWVYRISQSNEILVRASVQPKSRNYQWGSQVTLDLGTSGNVGDMTLSIDPGVEAIARYSNLWWRVNRPWPIPSTGRADAVTNERLRWIYWSGTNNMKSALKYIASLPKKPQGFCIESGSTGKSRCAAFWCGTGHQNIPSQITINPMVSDRNYLTGLGLKCVVGTGTLPKEWFAKLVPHNCVGEDARFSEQVLQSKKRLEL